VKIRRLLTGVLSSVILILLIHAAILIAGDIKDGVSRVSIQDLKAKMELTDGVLIIDVRSGDDYARSKHKIKGAVRISIVDLAEKSKSLPKDREIVTYCT